jgi:hypothetical protein
VAKNSLTLNYIKESLHLDESDYALYWRQDRPKSHFKSERSYRMYLGKYAGKRAGYVGLGGYHVVQFSANGKVIPIKAHHLIWRIVNNCDIPENMVVDHVSGIRSDNNIENLRLVTIKENARNQRKNSKNTSGFPGVSKNGNNFRSRITFNGELITLGNFSTPEKAHEAWLEAKQELGFYCGHGLDRPQYTRGYTKVKDRKEGLM